MSLPFPTGFYRAEPKYAGLLKRAGLVDGMSVFDHPKIEVWRSITERENCVLDLPDDAGGGRLHIKRNKPGHRGVEDEAAAIKLLIDANLGTVPLVAHGRLNDGRGFLITEDLAGYEDADIAVQNGLPFETVLNATADLAGRLHKSGLHHRDLYLCHFYVRVLLPSGPPPLEGGVRGGAIGASTATPSEEPLPPPPPSRGGGEETHPATDTRLMDAGRVRPLPSWFRRRWVVKDVAQFIYSVRNLDVPAEQIGRWLSHYSAVSGTVLDASFRRAVERKVNGIASHDAALRRRQPTRNVSIDR